MLENTSNTLLTKNESDINNTISYFELRKTKQYKEQIQACTSQQIKALTLKQIQVINE